MSNFKVEIQRILDNFVDIYKSLSESLDIQADRIVELMDRVDELEKNQK